MYYFRALDEFYLYEPHKRIIFTIPERALTPLVNNTDGFAYKLCCFFTYLENERINRKTVGVKTSMKNLSIHGLMAGIEAISRSKVGKIFYDFLENLDSI